MRHGFLVGLGLFASLALPASARAGPFKCPHTGGDLVFAQEADYATLDPMATSAIATRNIDANIFESLMTRDENNHPILDLAAAMHESPDHLTYTFLLRPGVVFHNGKTLTSADVAASFDRYARVGADRGILANVDHWDAPDPRTFAIHMKQPQPTFLEALSSYSAPIAIMPAEQRDTPFTDPIGTGPFQFAGGEPGTLVHLKRFDRYTPNRAFLDRTGLGGYKQACLNSVTFRIMADEKARIDALRAGEVQGVDAVPLDAAEDLKQDKNINLLPIADWWIQLAIPNVSDPPTDKLAIRQAIQAALDMDEIMRAASNGGYKLNVGFEFPDQPDHSDAGKQTYNQHDPDLAKKYLAEAGYQGEPVVLLTAEEYPAIYNAALTVQQQLQAVGINARLKVVSWPMLAQMTRNTTEGWNLVFTAWGAQPALGPLAVMRNFVPPRAVYKPQDGQADPDLLSAWADMNEQPTVEGRRDAFATMQTLVLDRVYALPFGVLSTTQAVRSDVHGFVPFRVPRMYNVWLERQALDR